MEADVGNQDAMGNRSPGVNKHSDCVHMCGSTIRLGDPEHEMIKFLADSLQHVVADKWRFGSAMRS